MKKEDLYKAAIKHWGEELQYGMLSEEVGELLVAINKFRRGHVLKGTVAEEMADVLIMMEQIQVLLEIDNDLLKAYYLRKQKKLEKMLKEEGK